MVIASFKAQSNFPQNNIKVFKLTIIISIKKKRNITTYYYFFYIYHQTIPYNLPTIYFLPHFPKDENL